MAKEKLEIVSLEENKLQYKGKEFVIPQGWEELTYDYLFAWVEAIRLAIEPNEFLQFILIHAIGIKEDLQKTLQKLSKRDRTSLLAELYKASENLLFIMDENKLGFSKIWKFKGMSCPAPMLAEFTAIEFIFASNYFKSFSESGKIEDLNKLCSILLRAHQRGKRKDFSESEEHYSLVKSKEIDLQDKLIICKAFEGEFLALTKVYPEIFCSQENQAEGFPYDMITNLAGDKFGTIKEVEKTNIHILFQYIVNQKKEIDRQKAQSNELE